MGPRDPEEQNAAYTAPIVFFDGLCGLCDRAVSFLSARDHRHRLRFAPLQGQAAAARLSDRHRDLLDTMVLWQGGKTYVRSTAVLRALGALGGAWGVLAGVLLVVPQALRDVVYGVVATNRYRWFGKKETCRLPSRDERAYFLD